MRSAAVALALCLAGCERTQLVQFTRLIQPGNAPWPDLLVCHGDFGQFANGYIVSRPMELSFVVDWAVPAVTPTNGGGPSRILSLTSLELSFEVPYETYKVAYHLDRVNGIFSQRPNLGGVFFGRCVVKPLETKV